MRLESALYTSREGLNANGQAIAVVGDNLANTNTIGFRASRVEFGDLVAEGFFGGGNSNIPSTGSGVQIQRVRPLQETGVIEATGRSLDIAIEGRGFLAVGDPENPSYTRAGNLSVSKDGILVDANGNNILGFASDNPDVLETLDVNKVKLSGTPTTAAAIDGNLDASSAITEMPTNPQTFNEIASSASYIANMSVYDSLGARHELTAAFFKTGAGEWKVQAYIDGADVGQDAGTPVALSANALTLNFGTDGLISEANQANAKLTATPAFSGGAATGNFTIDFSNFSQFAGNSQLSSVTQDGQASGNIKDYEIRKNGDFFAQLDTGQNIKIGTLRLADFVNVDALQRAGNGLFQPSADSGDRRLGTPGSEGFGTIARASLERSTVDIAEQFVGLVLYQRGYQASSQILNAAAGMLRDTLGLIR